jgi:exopolysaccharide biosynthesis polyprenyl glycosylphosphotransferase
MTPSQLAARLTIHGHEGDVALLDNHRLRAVDGALLADPARPLGLVENDDSALPSVFERESVHRRLLAGADMLAASLALILVLMFLGDARPALPALAGIPLVVVLFKIAGLYDRDQLRIVHSTLDELPLLAQLAGLYALSVTILEPILLQGTLDGLQIALLWLVGFGAFAGGRMLARWVAARLLPVERCLVIGEARRARRIREKLESSHAHAAVIATLPLEGDDEGIGNSPETIRRIARELQVDRIIIAPLTSETRGVVELIRIAKAIGVRVSVLPRMLEAVGSTVEFESVDGLTMLGVRPFGLSRSSRLLKRAFDLVATAIGLLVVGPIIAVIAVAIRLDSKGPVFFRQVRVGRDGRHFRIYKFRSMVVDAEEQKERLRSLNEVGDGMFKISHDPRVTRVGNLLRKTSLDELPQLFNVLRGEMSLVGPRPLVTDEDALVLGLDRSRLHLTPGMTGPWQVLGARVPMQEMVGIDYLYVASWSLWADLKLLLRTVRHVARRGNV